MLSSGQRAGALVTFRDKVAHTNGTLVCTEVSIYAASEGVPLIGDSAASPLSSARCLVPFGVPIQKELDKLWRRTETGLQQSA